VTNKKISLQTVKLIRQKNNVKFNVFATLVNFQPQCCNGLAIERNNNRDDQDNVIENEEITTTTDTTTTTKRARRPTNWTKFPNFPTLISDLEACVSQNEARSHNMKIIIQSESCILAVEYSAHDWKIVGSIPVQC